MLIPTDKNQVVLYRDLTDAQAQKVKACLERGYPDLHFLQLYAGEKYIIAVRSAHFLDAAVQHDFVMFILGVLAGME